MASCLNSLASLRTRYARYKLSVGISCREYGVAANTMPLADNAPLVSIIVPCYNQGRFLRYALDSALAQTYPNVEVVVVNDGSTDDTSEVARSYGDRIVLVEQENAGLSAARNSGILASSGEFIVLLDSDDVLLTECVSLRASHLIENPSVGIVAGYYREIDESGEMLPRLPEIRRISAQAHYYQAVKRNWGPPVGWTIRRSALEDCGMFDIALRSCEDWDLLIRITRRFDLAYEPTATALYRQLPGQMSRNHLVMLDAASKVLAKNAAVAPSRVGHWWWALFGRFQHGRRVLFNVLTTGLPIARLMTLSRLCLLRPSLLWIGFLSLLSLATGKRASA